MIRKAVLSPSLLKSALLAFLLVAPAMNGVGEPSSFVRYLLHGINTQMALPEKILGLVSIISFMSAQLLRGIEHYSSHLSLDGSIKTMHGLAGLSAFVLMFSLSGGDE